MCIFYIVSLHNISSFSYVCYFSQGYTALHIALQFDHENIFNLLVQVYGEIFYSKNNSSRILVINLSVPYIYRHHPQSHQRHNKGEASITVGQTSPGCPLYSCSLPKAATSKPTAIYARAPVCRRLDESRRDNAPLSNAGHFVGYIACFGFGQYMYIGGREREPRGCAYRR